MALAMARRVGGGASSRWAAANSSSSVWAPAAPRRRSYARSRSSSRWPSVARQWIRSHSSSATASRSAGWRASMPAAQRWIMQPGCADATIAPGGAGRGSLQRADLAVPDLAREPGWDIAYAPPRRSRAPRRRCPARHRPRRARCAPRWALLDVAQMARILDHDGPVLGAVGGGRREEPFGEVLHAGRERVGFGGAEQMAVLLHAGAAPGAVDHDRCRNRASTRSRGGRAPAPRRRGRRARGARRNTHPRAGGRAMRARAAHEARGAAMRVAHPRVHDAAGEEPRVGLTADVDDERTEAAADDAR